VHLPVSLSFTSDLLGGGALLGKGVVEVAVGEEAGLF